MALDLSPGRLRRLNVVIGGVHLAQAIAILALSNGFSIPVTAAFQDGPPGTPPGATRDLFDVAFGPVVALFLLFAAADHLLMGVPAVNRRYEGWLAEGRNPARWGEYSISASLMIVLIAMLTGITDLVALGGLFAANSAMILFGVLAERANPPGAPVDWRPFTFGCVVGAVPWAAVTFAIVGAEATGGDVPGFVYGIYVSLFVFFNSFAVVMWLHHRRVGRWADPRVAELGYLVLSLGAKTALAWQVFAGTLAT